MSKKNYCLLDESVYPSFLREMIEIFGLPELQQEFSIFAFNKKGDEFHINFTNSEVKLRLICQEDRGSSQIFVNNRNVKRLIQTISELGFEEASIGMITSFVFQREGDSEMKISKSTFLGNLLEINLESSNLKQAFEIIEKYKLPIMDRSLLQDAISKIDIPREPLFDEFKCINIKIKEACQVLGIDIFSPTLSLRNRFQKFSNDYTSLEKAYFEITGSDLKGTTGVLMNQQLFKAMSIIVPCFNSNKSIKNLLKAIQTQNLPKHKKQLIEVILVDDGSTPSVVSALDNIQEQFDFEIKIIRSEKNLGLSCARNLGVSVSKYEHLILIDSDILLSKDYLLEHSIRSQIIPNAIFVSMKKNISENDIGIPQMGLPNTRDVDDMRYKKNISKDQPALYPFRENGTVELLNDTNYFKDFSFGRNVGIFDLPSMVVGHNLSFRKRVLKNVGGFSREFSGWGMEDAFFGARAIALGNYVIPVLSVNVYHINHPPRSGTEEEKLEELKNNVKKYEDLLDREFVDY